MTAAQLLAATGRGGYDAASAAGLQLHRWLKHSGLTEYAPKLAKPAAEGGIVRSAEVDRLRSPHLAVFGVGSGDESALRNFAKVRTY